MADLAARRLIALLGHLTPDARIPLATLAEQMGTSEATLASDLITLSLCGVAPFYPGDCMPLIVEDGYVTVWGELPALADPVRLSASEASALASALQSAGFTAQDELPARLLEAAASATFDADALEHVIRTAEAAHNADVYSTLANALAEHAVVRIEYARAGTADAGERDIEPVSLFAERGAWYVTAWCRRAGDWRVFRVDRIRAADLTGEDFESERRGAQPSRTAFATEGLPTALLRFVPGERFDEREWPGARISVACDDGSLHVEVPFGGTDWVARRVLARLGRVEVLAPAEVRAAVSRLASAELARL